MWDLPGPGLEPVSPALAGGFLTTAPPEKSSLMNFDKRIWLYNQHHNQDIEQFHYPENPLVPRCSQPFLSLQSLATTDLFSVPIVLAFFRMPYEWNHTICRLWVWLLSLRIMI